MVSLTQQQIAAAKEFVSAAVGALRSDRGVHAETAIAGIARMAGTFLFRSFGFPAGVMAPGEVVLSEEANERGPALVDVLSDGLAQLGIKLDPAQLGGAPGPDHQPQLGFLESQRQLEPMFAAVRDRNGLTQLEAAEAGAAATAILIHQCSPVLDPHVAFGIAVYGFIEGAKTSPDPVAM